MTVVLDCNVLVICLTSRSPYHIIYQSLVTGLFNLAVTPEIILEYEEIITQKYGQKTTDSFLALLSELPTVLRPKVHYRWQLIHTDPDDNKYCDCAIAIHADHLITEDRHFDILQSIPFPKINVLSIEDFSQLLKTLT